MKHEIAKGLIYFGFWFFGVATGAAGWAIAGPKVKAATATDLKDWHARIADLEADIEAKKYDRVKAQVAILKNQIRTKLVALGSKLKEEVKEII